MSTPVLVQDEQHQRLEVKLRRELGEQILRLLDDSLTEDILLNPDGSLWVKQMGQGFSRIGEMPAAQAASALGTIAAWRGTVLNHEHPILETELPIDGSRFEGIVSPVVRRPVFAIRLRPRRIFSLDDYEADGILTDNTTLSTDFVARTISRCGARFQPCECDPRGSNREKEHARCRVDREWQDDFGQRDSRFASRVHPT